MQVNHFDLKTWNKLVDDARRDFYKTLGPLPTYRTTTKHVPNLNPVTSLQYVALFVFFVEFVFTSIKIGSGAGPYAENLLNIMTQHGAVDPIIRDLFAVITAVFFILLATPSVIYFKLLDHAPETVRAKKRTEIASKSQFWRALTLEWVTPRLPMTITYVSIAWLIFVSLVGGGNIFEMFLPILVGVGFAQTIADILEKNAQHRALVWGEVDARQKRWASRHKSFMQDEVFLNDFYVRLRDALTNLVVGGQRVNAWMADTDPQIVDDIILSEFRRFSGNLVFSKRIKELDYEKQAASTEKRVPPNDAQAWTSETLYRDLQTRGISTYTEAQLIADYDAQYKARRAWRNGARELLEQSYK